MTTSGSPLPLTDTPALVTGATSGLGRATATRLAEAGADLAVVGRSESDLAELASILAGHGVEVLPLVADLADTAALGSLVDRSAEQLGGLGLLVNAAATDSPGTAEELALAAEGRAHDIRVCVLYPGAMATNWGTFDPAQRSEPTGRPEEQDALDPAVVADLIGWLASSPGQPVLNEVTVTPLREAGWP